MKRFNDFAVMAVVSVAAFIILKFDEMSSLLGLDGGPELLGAKLIKRFEGFSPKKYWDAKRFSIGYGTEALAGDTEISEQEAEARLIDHLKPLVEKVNGVAGLDNNQKAALLSFGYNVGAGGLDQQISRLKSGWSLQDVAAQLAKWVRVNGEANRVLTERRKAEIAIFLKEAIV